MEYLFLFPLQCTDFLNLNNEVLMPKSAMGTLPSSPMEWDSWDLKGLDQDTHLKSRVFHLEPIPNFAPFRLQSREQNNSSVP